MEYIQPDAVAMVLMCCSRLERAQGSSCIPMATREAQPTASGTGRRTAAKSHQHTIQHLPEPCWALQALQTHSAGVQSLVRLGLALTSSRAHMARDSACQGDERGVCGEHGGLLLFLSELLLVWKLLGSSSASLRQEKVFHSLVVVSKQTDVNED